MVSILLSSVSALSSSNVLAASNAEEPSSTDEQMTVLGKTYRNTATKTSLAPEETPQTLNIITSEEMEQRGAKSVMQALRYAPGVATENKGGAVVFNDFVTIRGFGSSQNYYDGLMLPELPGWNAKPQIDPIAMERLEIFKGPTSVLYGSMPPGGMVNIIAKAPSFEENTKVNVATGLNNLMEASIDKTGALSDNVSYRLIALGRKKDSTIDHVKEERYVFAPSVNWNVSDSTLVNFNLYYQNDPNLGQNVSVPIEAIESGKMSASTFAGDTNFNEIKREFVVAGYKINHEFNNDWTFLQNFRYMETKFDQKTTQSAGSDGFNAETGELQRTAYTTDEQSKGLSIDNQLSGFVNTGSVDHYLLFGIDYRSVEGDSAYNSFTGVDSINLYNPDNSKLDPNNFTPGYYSNTDVSIKQLGGYFQDQMLVDNWVLMAGGRYDLVESSTDKSENGGTTNNTTSRASNFSYRLGALYQFDNGLSPFANFATSFEPNAKVDASGKNLDPETGEQIEAGVKYTSFDSTTSASAALFHIKKQNVGVRRDGNAPWEAVGEVRSQGLELEGHSAVTESLDIIANYTYTDMEITKDDNQANVGQKAIYVPDHAANLWANYTMHQGVMQGLRVGGGVRYVGNAALNNGTTNLNTGTVPSYTLVDLSIGYDLGQVSDSMKGATANVIANNLFNQEYYSCYSQSYCWVGQQQTVELNIKFDL
ncbi:TonB-dependent siderophore receptor [Vibrio methylphosphonaticus]|uniref:TonB-dependent siderophore receptor n=1 Tax=Vibrio methylphosphonaticus TaxID=2946866 RepID=UPI003873A7BC